MKIAGLSWEPPLNPLLKWSQPNLQLTQAEYDELLEEMEGFCMECGQIHAMVDPDIEDKHCDYCQDNAVYGLKRLLECKGVDIVEPDGLEWYDR